MDGIYDLRAQFLAHAGLSISIQPASNWANSEYLRNIDNALIEVQSLAVDVTEAQKTIGNKFRLASDRKTKIVAKSKDSLNGCQKTLRRLAGAEPDLRGSKQMVAKFKSSVQSILQLRVMTLSHRMNQALSEDVGKIRTSGSTESPQKAVNTNRAHFIEQTEQQAIQQATLDEFRKIQQSLHQVSGLYKHSIQQVKLHDMLIEGIESGIIGAEDNLGEGRKHLVDIQRSQQGNRAFILKIFGFLYVLVFVYTIILN